MSEASQKAVRAWLGTDGNQVQTKLRGIVAARGIPISLMAGVVEVESGGQPEVVSWAGAVGLGQVMPSDPAVDPRHFDWLTTAAANETAQEMEHSFRAMFSDRPTTAQLKIPCVNLAWAAQILQVGLMNWGGDLNKALAAYLGGITATGVITDEGQHYINLVCACQEHFLDLD
jgi:soluble lytic murein transglycosylase-like protein